MYNTWVLNRLAGHALHFLISADRHLLQHISYRAQWHTSNVNHHAPLWMETVTHLLYDQFTRWAERCSSTCAGFSQFAPSEETKLYILSTVLAFFIPSVSTVLSSLFRLWCWCWPCPSCGRFTTLFSGPCGWLCETMRAKQSSKPWTWATSAGVWPLLFLRLVKTRLCWPQALL